MKTSKTAQWRVASPIGPLFLVASEKGLRGIFWKKHSAPVPRTLRSPEREIRMLSRSVLQLRSYFAGRLKKFALPTDAEGTPFQKKVWSELARIPYGQTRSYRDIARRIKNPKAVRAVGSANGRNPLCVVVPCHRVIAADGSIGGYSGGLDKKIKLLRLERRGSSGFTFSARKA